MLPASRVPCYILDKMRSAGLGSVGFQMTVAPGQGLLNRLEQAADEYLLLREASKIALSRQEARLLLWKLAAGVAGVIALLSWIR